MKTWKYHGIGCRYRAARIWWNHLTLDEQICGICLVYAIAGLIWLGVVLQLGGTAYV